MTTAPKLEPCPFCGSTEISQSLGKHGDGKDWPYIECEGCGAITEPDVWNRRAAPSARLREALEKTTTQLDNLHAMVCGECPSLLEDHFSAPLIVEAIEVGEAALALPGNERAITSDELIDLIDKSPDNELAHGVVMMRSGRRLKISSFVDIEKLADLVNRHFATSPKA